MSAEYSFKAESSRKVLPNLGASKCRVLRYSRWARRGLGIEDDDIVYFYKYKAYPKI